MIDTFDNSTKNLSVASQSQLLQLHGELEPTTPHHQALQTSPVAFILLLLNLLVEDTDSYKSWTYTSCFTVHPPTSELFILMD